MKFNCHYCGKENDRNAAHIRRALEAGNNLYCDRKCSAMGRRTDKRTDEQKKADKAEYDRQYRAKNREKLKKQKKEYFQRTYDPVKQRAYNQSRMKHHVEYCRRPEYKAYKKEYDRIYRAKKKFGEFWESHIAILDIEAECLRRESRYKIMLKKGQLGKTQKRRRDYERAKRQELEDSPVGNLERCEGEPNGAHTS